MPPADPRRWRLPRAAATLLLALAALCAGGSPAAARSVPQGFAGMHIEGELVEGTRDLDGELGLMVSAGVESVRTAFTWSQAQPYPIWEAVPEEERGRFRDVGGVPTDFSATDRLVRAAAARHLQLLPVVIEAPPWSARHPGVFASPPQPRKPYAAFVAALARRYGSRGTFWAENPDVPRRPIRDWQIWNEPNLFTFWSDQPSARDYAALLAATRPALRRADSRARIVLGGLVNRSWDALEALYRAGAGRNFDVVAIHPFTREVDGVFTILRYARRAMARHGDSRKPLVITELSWTSAAGRIPKRAEEGFEATEAGQASNLRNAYTRLARARRRLRIEQVFWFTWLSPDVGDWTFSYAGLRRIAGDGAEPKPAFGAFAATALALQGCAAKREVATACVPERR